MSNQIKGVPRQKATPSDTNHPEPDGGTVAPPFPLGKRCHLCRSWSYTREALCDDCLSWSEEGGER